MVYWWLTAHGAQWLMCSLSPSNILSLKKTLINCQIFNNLEVSFYKYLIIYRSPLWIHIWHSTNLRWFDNIGTALLEGHSGLGFVCHIYRWVISSPVESSILSSLPYHSIHPSYGPYYPHLYLATLNMWVKKTINILQSFSGTFIFTFHRHF